MPKSAVRAAIDAAVSEAMAPDLKARGFRKKRLRWTWTDGAREIVVHVEGSSKNNRSGYGAWRLWIRWAAELPQGNGLISGRVLLGTLKGKTVVMFDWGCNAGDPLSVHALQEKVTNDWRGYGAPLLDACSDAPALVRFLVAHVNAPVPAASVVNDALKCLDDELVEAALENLSESIRLFEQESPDEPVSHRLLAFSSFAHSIDEVDLSTRSQDLLRTMMDGLDRPAHETAAGWFDAIDGATQP